MRLTRVRDSDLYDCSRCCEKLAIGYVVAATHQMVAGCELVDQVRAWHAAGHAGVVYDYPAG